MANGTLQSLFREPTYRHTDRAAFAQAISRISCNRSRKEEDQQKLTKIRQKEA